MTLFRLFARDAWQGTNQRQRTRGRTRSVRRRMSLARELRVEPLEDRRLLAVISWDDAAQTLLITAGPGEVNTMNVVEAGGNLSVTDTGAALTLDAATIGAGPNQLDATLLGDTATVSLVDNDLDAVNRVRIELGDQPDSLTLDADTGVLTEVVGGSPDGRMQRSGDSLNIVTGGIAGSLELNFDLTAGSFNGGGNPPINFEEIEEVRLDGALVPVLTQRPTIDLLAADDSGSSSLDGVTRRANNVPLTVTAEVGAEVVIKDGNTIIDGPFVSSGSNVRSVALGEGTHLLSAEASEEHDLIATLDPVRIQSEQLTVTIDRTLPGAPAGLDLLSISDTLDPPGTAGSVGSNIDGVTKINAPAIAGTGEPNALVRVFSGSELVGQGTVTSGGAWEITLEPLADGAYSLTAVQEDLAGNVSGPSAALAIAVVTLGPAPPTLDLAAADDTGLSNRDNVTRRASPVPLTITAQPGSHVFLRAGQTVLEDFVMVGTSMVRNLALPADGVYLLRAESFDAAGNRSLPSGDLELTVDRTAPAALASFALLASSDTFDDVAGLAGPIGNDADGVTAIRQPAFSGTAEANAMVRIYADGELVGQAVVGSDESDGVPGDGLGAWEITVEPLADGVHALTAEVEDLAGNITSGLPGEGDGEITIDALAPQRPTLDLPAALDSGNSSLDNVTNAANGVAFTVTAEAGSRVLIKNGETVIDDFVMPGLTTTRTLTLAEGTRLLSAEAFDLAGNRSAQSEELVATIDRTEPAAPSVPDLAATSDSGPTHTDDITAVIAPAFLGTAEANARVRIFANGVLVGQGLVGSDATAAPGNDQEGAWEVTVEPLAYGQYRITAEVEDLAGNVSPLTDPLVITVDPYEPNDTLAQATELGSLPEVTLRDVLLHNAADADIFHYRAHATGMLSLSATSADAIGLRAWDAQANILATATQSAIVVGLNADRLAIPVVAGEDYFVQVFFDGEPPEDFVQHVAIYGLEIENFAAPVPASVMLDPNDDSGGSNRDAVTLVDDARLFISVDLEAFDDAGITLLDAAAAAAGATAGAAVQVFLNGQSIGFADPLPGSATLFALRLDLSGDLLATIGEWSRFIPISTGGRTAPPRVVTVDNAGYLNRVQAAVRIFDLQETAAGAAAPAEGRTQLSPVQDVHFDPNAPDGSLATIDMLTTSDTSGGSSTTRISQPAFGGVAEANALIRLFATAVDPNTGLPLGDPQPIGEGRVGSDGSDVIAGGNARDGLGLWEITVEPLAEGTYRIAAEIEDLAGNVSDIADSAVVIATVDTLAPQRPTIDLVGANNVGNDKLGAPPLYSDTGASIYDNVTRGAAVGVSDTTVQVRVTAEPGSTVLIKDGEEVIDTFAMPAIVTTAFEIGAAQQVPPNASAGTGTGTIQLDALTGQLSWNIQWSGLTGVVTVAHFHGPAPLGVNAGIQVNLTPSIVGDTAVGNTLLSPAQVSQLLAGQWYVNIHTNVFPAGEIRGQVLFGDGNIFGDQLDFVYRQFTLDEGVHPLSVEVFDAAGNRSEQSEELQVTVDITPPDPARFTIDLLAASDTGRFSDDNVTASRTPIFAGIAEAGSRIRIYANGELVGQGMAGSDESDGVPRVDPPNTLVLGVWEIALGALDDGNYNLTVQIEDLAGNIALVNPQLTANALIDLEIDAVAPNTPFLDLVEASDSGRHDDDNITNDSTPNVTLTSEDPDAALHLLFTDNLMFRIYDRFEENVEFLLYDSAQDAAADAVSTAGDGLTSLNRILATLASQFVTLNPAGNFAVTAAGQLRDGIHNLKLEVQDRAGNLSQDFLLDLLIDVQAYLGDGNLHTDSDSGVAGYLATFGDRITNDRLPSFFGVAEANNVVTVAIDGTPAGTAVAVPLDGDDAFQPPLAPYAGVEGNWRIESNLNLADGQHSAVFTFEDPAGNRTATAALLFFVDTQGPRITDIDVNNAGNPYDLFDHKDSPDGALRPTPLINALVIHVSDLPARTAAFLYSAVFAGTAEDPGHYQLVGDASGIIPIATVAFNNVTLVAGQAATGTITLTFAQPLPDDRFTLTISDSITDVAGNPLDGESNLAEPQEPPQFPSGDGVPGGDFVARFTVDSRPEVGVFHSGSVWVDTNGNGHYDPQNFDFTNRDITYVLGYTTDDLFAGNFAAVASTIAAAGVPGASQVGGTVTIRTTAAHNLSVGQRVTIAGIGVAGYNGEFAITAVPTPTTFTYTNPVLGLAASGGGTVRQIADGFDKLAAYGRVGTNFRWLIDTDNDGVPNPAAGIVEPLGLNGLPVAGNFDNNAANGDEVGLLVGTTWWIDTNHDYRVDTQVPAPAGGPLSGLPIVGDFDGDGHDDLGTWQDDRFTFLLTDGVDKAWLVGAAVPASIDFGFIGVREKPVAADLDRDGIDDIGLFVPDRAGINPEEAAEWYFLVSNDPLETARIDGTVVTLAHPFTPVPFGADQHLVFGDEFAAPVIGNFDPPPAPLAAIFTQLGLTNLDDAADVNGDGEVTPQDALILVNEINANGVRQLTQGRLQGPFLDVSGDRQLSARDVLEVINRINAGSPLASLDRVFADLAGEEDPWSWL